MTDLTYTKTVPLAAETEVIVVGGGPAGIAAAIASAAVTFKASCAAIVPR